jgi:hypothetical protein
VRLPATTHTANKTPKPRHPHGSRRLSRLLPRSAIHVGTRTHLQGSGRPPAQASRVPNGLHRHPSLPTPHPPAHPNWSSGDVRSASHQCTQQPRGYRQTESFTHARKLIFNGNAAIPGTPHSRGNLPPPSTASPLLRRTGPAQAMAAPAAACADAPTLYPKGAHHSFTAATRSGQTMQQGGRDGVRTGFWLCPELPLPIATIAPAEFRATCKIGYRSEGCASSRPGAARRTHHAASSGIRLGAVFNCAAAQ